MGNRTVTLCSVPLCLAAQSRLTLWDPLDCSPPGSSVHGILQARRLEWVAISSSRGSSRRRDQTCVSCTVGGFFTWWATGEGPQWHYYLPKITPQQSVLQNCTFPLSQQGYIITFNWVTVYNWQSLLDTDYSIWSFQNPTEVMQGNLF